MVKQLTRRVATCCLALVIMMVAIYPPPAKAAMPWIPFIPAGIEWAIGAFEVLAAGLLGSGTVDTKNVDMNQYNGAFNWMKESFQIGSQMSDAYVDRLINGVNTKNNVLPAFGSNSAIQQMFDSRIYVQKNQALSKILYDATTDLKTKYDRNGWDFSQFSYESVTCSDNDIFFYFESYAYTNNTFFIFTDKMTYVPRVWELGLSGIVGNFKFSYNLLPNNNMWDAITYLIAEEGLKFYRMSENPMLYENLKKPATYSTTLGASVAIPPLETFEAEIVETKQKLLYDYSTGKYKVKDTGAAYTPAKPEDVKWTAPLPKKVVDTATGQTKVVVDVPKIGGGTREMDVKEQTPTAPIDEPIPLADFTIALPAGRRITMAQGATLDLGVVYEPENVLMPALIFVVVPAIASINSRTGRITATAEGTATVTATAARAGEATKSESFELVVTAEGTLPTSEINLEPLKVAGYLFTTRFPFSLPWDAYKQLSVFDIAPHAPVLKVDETIPVFGTTMKMKFDIDFTIFEKVAVVSRWFLILGFDLGLVLAIRKLLTAD